MNEQPETAQTDEMGADARFVRRAADVLNASMSGVPPAITARLNSIRESVVASAETDSVGVSAMRSPVVSKPGEPMPAGITDRLDDIRARAMQLAARQSQDHNHGFLMGWRGRLASRLSGVAFGVPAGAFASICVLFTTLAIFNVPTSDEPLPAALAEEVLLQASVDDIELYENLEFYQWLAENGL